MNNENNRLKELRQEKGYTQAVVAGLLGYYTNTYQRWEHDIYTMKLPDLITIAKFYNVSLDYLAGLTDEKRKHW